MKRHAYHIDAGSGSQPSASVLEKNAPPADQSGDARGTLGPVIVDDDEERVKKV